MRSHSNIDNDFFLVALDTEPQCVPHYHEFAEILFTDDSPLSLLIDIDHAITAEPGSIVYIPPQTRHLVSRPLDSSPCRSLQINLQRLYLMVAQTPYVSPIEKLYEFEKNNMVFSGEAAKKIIEMSRNIKNEFELSNLSEVIQIICLLDNERSGVYDGELRRKSKKEIDLCASLNVMLSNSPARNWNIDHIAKKFFMSRSTFNRIIKKNTGMPFHSWILQRKMDLACESLRTQEKSIQEISDILGFSSASHFSKAFRDRFGTTPSEYRLAQGQPVL